MKNLGTLTTFEGKPAIVAAEIKKGNEALKLWDENGFPVWSGWRRQQFNRGLSIFGGDTMAIPRITKEELKAKMDKNEDLVIVDARAEDSYNSSNQKIKGALRITLEELERDVKKIPEGREVITYCT